ncbi:hypothetical protein [Rhodopseudomonas sp. BAL398]
MKASRGAEESEAGDPLANRIDRGERIDQADRDASMPIQAGSR